MSGPYPTFQVLISRRKVVVIVNDTRVEAAHYVQELTYLMIACQQEGAYWRWRPAVHVLVATL